MNFIVRFLLRRLLPRKQHLKVRCSGIISQEKGVGYCFKELELGDALELNFHASKQIHNIYFCNFQCLSNFLQHRLREGG